MMHVFEDDEACSDVVSMGSELSGFGQYLNSENCNIPDSFSVVQAEVEEMKNGFVVLGIYGIGQAKYPENDIDLGFDDVPKNLAEGDKVDVFLEEAGSRSSTVKISRVKAIKRKIWNHLKNTMQERGFVEGVVVQRIRGGCLVDVAPCILDEVTDAAINRLKVQFKAFLPVSQVCADGSEVTDEILGLRSKFSVLNMDRKNGGSVVVSRKFYLYHERREKKKTWVSSLERGSMMDGLVKNITEYGAFINLGGVADGLLHISDMSWNSISHPAELLECGQSVKVIILDYTQEGDRICLGMKQLQENPLEKLGDNYKEGGVYSGVVTGVRQSSLFVELEGSGVCGIVPGEEAVWGRYVGSLANRFTMGDPVTVMLLSKNTETCELILSIKRCDTDPSVEFAKMHSIGTVVKGRVNKISKKGIYLSVSSTEESSKNTNSTYGSVWGIVMKGDVTWDSNPVEEMEKYNVGDEIDVKILSHGSQDSSGMMLGIKQLIADPVSDAFDAVNVGDKLSCSVVSVSEKCVEMEYGTGAKVFMHNKDLNLSNEDSCVNYFKIGNQVDVIVTGICRESMRLECSVAE